MGREAATWMLALSPPEAEAVTAQLDAAGLPRVTEDADRVDYVLRDQFRYWIDLRVHHAPQRSLEIRIALTNDTWSIRAPLERVLTPLAPVLGSRPICDDDEVEVATLGAEGWSLALEDDYARRRDGFVARVGDYTAPLSADHVYMYLHQTRWNEDNDAELEWHREREIAKLEASWDADDAPEPEIEDS